MARTGLYKSEVKKARDTLVVQGKHPSVDAVRIELGNTGSKTTIHKYLKELEEEEGGAGGRQASVSEAVLALVERLAGQLQAEADERIGAMQARTGEKERLHAETTAALQNEVTKLTDRLQQLEAIARRENEAHAQTHEALQQESIARATLEQQVADLKERLVENESHRQSLEEKHQHARDALEHYRHSVKEQRDQDQRRHEHQIQQLQAELRQAQQSLVGKQDEVTRLNQEGTRLVSDLSHAEKRLFDEQNNARQLATRLEALQGLAQRCQTLETLSAEKAELARELKAELNATTAHVDVLAGEVRTLELELAAAKGKLEAQQALVDDFRDRLVPATSAQNSVTSSV